MNPFEWNSITGRKYEGVEKVLHSVQYIKSILLVHIGTKEYQKVTAKQFSKLVKIYFKTKKDIDFSNLNSSLKELNETYNILNLEEIIERGTGTTGGRPKKYYSLNYEELALFFLRVLFERIKTYSTFDDISNDFKVNLNYEDYKNSTVVKLLSDEIKIYLDNIISYFQNYPLSEQTKENTYWLFVEKGEETNTNKNIPILRFGDNTFCLLNIIEGYFEYLLDREIRKEVSKKWLGLEKGETFNESSKLITQLKFILDSYFILDRKRLLSNINKYYNKKE